MANPRWSIPVASVLLAVLAACGQGPSTTPTVTSVTISPRSLELVVGDNATLTATVNASDGAAGTVAWQSSDASLVTVNAGGTVSAIGAGTATVTATSDDDPSKTASTQITVLSEGEVGGPAPHLWDVQFGSNDGDVAGAVAVDAQGFVVVVGTTWGDLAGTSAGHQDGFVRKLMNDGEEVWTRQFGTPAVDYATAVATDLSGNIIVAGNTHGSLGGPNAGSEDVFVRMYTPDGDLAWTVQFGSDHLERATAVVVDGEGDVIVAGRSYGGEPPNQVGFVRKYRIDAGGGGASEVWTYDAPEAVVGLAVDGSGNLIATGYRWIEGLGREAYVLKLTAAGEERWTRLYGTGAAPAQPGGRRAEVPATRRPQELWENLGGFEDEGHAVATDAQGNIYLTGFVGAPYTYGIGISSTSAFLMKLDPDGEELWALLFGDTHATFGNAVTVAPDGDVVVSGNIGSHYGSRAPGNTEMFVRRFTPGGTQRWADEFGGVGTEIYGGAVWDMTHGVATDARGDVFMTGYTYGVLGGPQLGSADVFLRKYGEDR